LLVRGANGITGRRAVLFDLDDVADTFTW